jgi:hypothetical protein
VSQLHRTNTQTHTHTHTHTHDIRCMASIWVKVVMKPWLPSFDILMISFFSRDFRFAEDIEGEREERHIR